MYDHWRGVFYPHAAPKHTWFEFYAQHFDTVEINNTFYSLPTPATFDAWRRRAPAGFCYALKFSRYGTHLKRLRQPRAAIDAFLPPARRLQDMLGPILLQLPPRWRADAQRLHDFLQQAPRRHRWAVEFRDRSWLCDEVYAVLRAHNAALCIHDLIEEHPRVRTADWVYLRFHGRHDGGSYTPQRLAAEARRIRNWLAAGADVFAYFNNDREGHAVRNARQLRAYVDTAVRRGTHPPAPSLGKRGGLEGRSGSAE
jgi:uncharacterized protein YecE (DUF72 family)